MKIVKTDLPGVLVFEPQVFGDSRGYFLEVWNRARYVEAGVPGDFVQDNLSYSLKGVLRGLHFQEPFPQGKLVHVLQGEIYDVTVDIRVGSPTLGRWVGVSLSSETRRQLYVPPGFAHGFVVVSESALVGYKCTESYRPQYEASLRWDDPKLGIEWPVADPSLSAKDAKGLRLDEFPPGRLPRYQPPG